MAVQDEIGKKQLKRDNFLQFSKKYLHFIFMRAFFSVFSIEYFKWIQSLKISLSRNLYYKTNFLLMMVIPVLVFFAIKYNLWNSIYATNSNQNIQGYSLSKMIEYQFWILIFDLFVRSHFFSQNISSDIRLGKISSFLLYPFGFISYQLSLFLSDKLIQIFIGLFSLFLAIVFDWIPIPSASALLTAGAFILMINFFWFFTQLLIGFVSFWLEETWSINVSIRFISAFLSGSIIPLDLYPDFFEKIVFWTPFPYLIYIPVRILMGEAIDAPFSFLLLFIWSLVIFFISQWAWKKGLNLYTGAGI